MEVSIGILIIGSLYWDDELCRARWWHERLDLSTPRSVLAPTRYGRINDYFANAVTVFAANADRSARVAALAAGKVAASEQRQSMVNYLRAIADDYKPRRASEDDLPSRLNALAEEIASKDWQLEDITVQKLILGEHDPQYLEALDASDPTVFVHKFPHLSQSAPPR